MRIRTGLLAAMAFAAGALGVHTFAEPASNPPAQTPAASQQTSSQQTPPPEKPASKDEAPKDIGKVTVTSDLDQSVANIAPSLGAQTYTLTPQKIEAIPGGENAPFQQVLLRAPGVVQDNFGQVHVRGEHANLTYRINGVLLPQPIAQFGQELDTRLVQTVTLIDGSLPAQFGFHTAGIVDVTTKSGETLDHNEISLYGGSFDTINPSVQLGGTIGKLDYFITTSYNHSDIGIENPTGTHRPLHDYTDQGRVFGYLAYRLDDTSRISVLANASYGDFQIPNIRGVAPAFTFTGHPTFDSATLNENQSEQEYYTVLSYQKSIGEASFQLSGFTRYGQIRFTPDPTGDLLLQGVAGNVYNSFLTSGVQLDSSYVLNDSHTLRAGLIADYTSEVQNTSTALFTTDPVTGLQNSNTPITIVDDSGNWAWESGAYVQDEWRLNKQWTLNYGLRYDRFDASFDHEDQVSPRANLVYKIDDATTAHAGYARYFVPPPVQNVTVHTISKFTNTTNAPNNLMADPGRVERSNYYDAGISRQITKPLSVSIDGFYKAAKNLVDLGQFGTPLILAPFNYAHGTVYGAELSTNYKQGGFTAFGNFSWVKTMAHDIDSQEFLIANDRLAFIKNHNIHLDHDNEFAVSTGMSYQWKNDMVYLDFLYGSGLRGGFANTHQLQQHYPVNCGYEHVFHLDGGNKKAVKLRVDLVNLFDEKYQIRSGSGVGVGAPQFGQRRSVFVGVTYAF